MLRSIGLGQRMPFIVARQLMSDAVQDLSESDAEQNDDSAAMMIKGSEGTNLSFAHCCHPIPGDPIIGLPGADAGMVIHSEGCTKVMNLSNNQAQVHLSWVKDITDEFTVELQVELERQRGIIAELASAITHTEGNIERIGVTEQNAKLSVVSVVLHVQGRRHLARVMRRIRAIKAVLKLTRVISK